ncbi:dihydrofolate reductase family protein [Pedococcus sp. 5OH_020]|uniref:dihydrofolate reductase family protein n=1 Tax=Pedococcus sp. 5OH_020 TaxID=2989814 RepID=UPI0022EA0639|nr:dihydrofolate reductase family protein [Pedococcus sp. 5OH_020]
MRLLLSESGALAPGTELDDASLRELYAAPSGRSWLRVNFVSSLDGAVTGPDGRSGSINTAADFRVFQLLRRLSDVVVVGAGTVRAEGYPALRDEDVDAPVLAVVSNSGALPETVARMTSPRGSALLLTRRQADPARLSSAREVLGEDNVVLVGDEAVDLVQARAALEDKGFRHLLCEGGPTLFGHLLAAGVVDEVDLTWAPAVVGGTHARIVRGTDLDVDLSPLVLVEEDGSVIGRWQVKPVRPLGPVKPLDPVESGDR